MPRLSPRAEVLRALFARSGNRCAFPGCNAVLVNERNQFVANVCHIEAAEEGGERFNPLQSDEIGAATRICSFSATRTTSRLTRLICTRLSASRRLRPNTNRCLAKSHSRSMKACFTRWLSKWSSIGFMSKHFIAFTWRNQTWRWTSTRMRPSSRSPTLHDPLPKISRQSRAT